MKTVPRLGASGVWASLALSRFGVLAVLTFFAACQAAPPPPLPQEVFSGPTMGTTYTVKVVGQALEVGERREVAEAIVFELEAVNEAMSTYLEDSELSRFNRHPAGEPFPLSPASQEVFRQALELAELTGGAFDITVGPLVDAWGFGPGETPTGVPEENRIAELRDQMGYHHLSLQDAGGSTLPDSESGPYLVKAKEALRCDLSAIAKGYAVDRVATLLEERDFGNFMVEVGGEVRASGHNREGKVWRIGIERPQALRGAVHRIVPLQKMAMATSGDYRNIRAVGEDWVSHIVDPRSGRPVPHTLASVTVLHPSCATADALATAFMVLGPEEGHALAEEEGLAVLFLTRVEERLVESTTSAFARLASGGSAAIEEEEPKVAMREEKSKI